MFLKTHGAEPTEANTNPVVDNNEQIVGSKSSYVFLNDNAEMSPSLKTPVEVSIIGNKYPGSTPRPHSHESDGVPAYQSMGGTNLVPRFISVCHTSHWRET